MTRKNERLFKPAYATELLKVAKEDLATARVLMDHADSVRSENTIFHIQQATEKSLKAVICHKGLPIPMTHDLDLISQKFQNEDEPPHCDLYGDLTPFATIRRYEEGNEILTAEDVKLTFSIAKDVYEWALKQVCNA